MWGLFPHTSKQFSDTSWVSCNSTQFWHYLLGDSVRFHRLRAQLYKAAPLTPHFRCQSQVWVVCRLEVPMTPSLGLFNLLEQLTELRETFYLLDYWLIIKGYNSGTARWKRCVGQGMWEGARSFCALSECMPSPNLHVFTNLEALWALPFWVFVEGSLHWHD